MPVFSSMGQMAAATGIPLAILKKAKRHGCMFMRRNTCDLQEFISWWFNNDLTDEQKEDWGMRRERADAIFAEVRAEDAQKRVVEFSLVEQYLATLVRDIFFGELTRMTQQFPSSLKGKTEIQIRDECEKNEERVKLELEERLKLWLTQSEDAR